MRNQVFKLDGEPLYVFGSVTMNQAITYMVMFFVIQKIAGGFVTNNLITMAIASVVVFITHQLGAQLLDQVPLYQINNFVNFVKSADQYVIKPDPQALPNVVELMEDSHERSTKRIIRQIQTS